MSEENYAKIAKLFEELSIEFKNLSEQEEQVTDTQISELRENMTSSEELFFKIVNVYVEETKRKSNLTLKRKSGVLLAKNSNKVYIEFLSNRLPVGYTVSELESNPTFIVIRDKQNKPKSVLRFITDLGYQRGIEFGKKELVEIKKIAKKLNISEDQIYVIVLSMINSLDEKDVKDRLKDPMITNRQLLGNRTQMKNYVFSYIESFSRIIPNPTEHIFVLSYNLHPNIIADELFDNHKSIYDHRSGEINDVMPKIISNIIL